MGGKLGFGGRLIFAALLAGVLLFAATGTVSADGPQTWTVSIGNASPGSSPEGDAPGANSMTFPLALNGGGATTTPAAIDVTYTSSEGTAPQLVIPAGTAAGTFNLQVPINGNTTPQDDRTMTVTLTNVAFDASDTTDSISLGSPTSGTGTIIDDDWRIAGLTSSPANATVSEASGATIDFQVALVGPDGTPQNAPSNHAIKVNYALTDGSGDAGAKFGKNYKVTQPASGAQSGTLTFAPGTGTVDVKVQALNDNVYGYDKTFTMTVSSPQGASFAAGAATSETGTITESSSPPVLAISSPCGTVTGGTVATIPLETSFASPIPATVTWTTSNGTAVAGDYKGGTGTATVPAGSRDGSITIQTNENPPPGSRTFTVTLSSPQHVTFLNGAQSTTCTITEPSTVSTDTLPSYQFTNPAPIVQPAAGGTALTVPISVTLNPPVVQPSTPVAVDLKWQTQDGTATAPADYTSASGTLHWDAGKFSTQPINVQIPPATGTSNSPLTFTIVLSTLTAAPVAATNITVTVVPPASPPVLAVSDASALESAGSIPAVVSLAPSSTNSVTVQYATADGTAKAGSDYTSVSGTLTFAPGQTSKTVAIPVTNNTANDGNRSFTFVISKPTNATISDASATMTIRDDDVPTPQPPTVVNTGPPQIKPTPLPVKQPTASKHVVLVQVLTGTSTIDPKGYVHFRLNCPEPAVKTCQGTVLLQVRVPGKKPKGSKKDPPLKTVTVGTGKFKMKVNKFTSVKVKITKQGLALLKSYQRFKVKATVNAKDAENVKGVTAWFVTVQLPARSITIKTKK